MSSVAIPEALPVPPATVMEHVRAEQLRTYLTSARIAIVPAAVLALIFAIVVWPHTDHTLLIGWLIVLLVCYGARAALTWHDLPQWNATEDVRRLDRAAIATAALTGTAWGAVAILPLPEHQIEYPMFLCFLISGVTASATSSLGTHRQAALAFVLPCVLPLAMRMLLFGSQLGSAMGVMILLYLAVVYATVERIAKGLEDAVRLRIQADLRGTALAESRTEQHRHQQLLRLTAKVQTDFIRGHDPQRLFSTLVSDLMTLTGSNLGFVAEAERGELESRGLKIRAVKCVQWCADTDIREQGFRIDLTARDLSILLADEELCGGPLIVNDAHNEICRSIAVEGTVVQSFVGLPLYSRDKFVGVIGLANRTGGYDSRLADDLQPLASIVAHIVLAMHAEHDRREAELRLKRARAQLDTCVTDTPAAVAMLDRDLRFVAYSQQWLKDFGLPMQDLDGRSLYATVPEIPPRWRESFARVLAGQVEQVEDDPFIRANGTVCWLRWEARPWYEPGRVVGGLVLFSTDVTAQKKINDALHARERLLEQLTDRVPGLLFQIRVRADGQRSMLYASSGALRVLHVTSDRLIESPDRLFEVCHPADRTALEAALVKATASGYLHTSFRGQYPNGEVRWLSIEADATRLADASSIWHGYVHDITEQMHLEKTCPVVDTASGIESTQAGDKQVEISELIETAASALRQQGAV